MPSQSLPIALKKCPGYSWLQVSNAVGDCLEAASLNLPNHAKVLVKPNLLTSKRLACTHPFITVAVCAWLKEHGHHPFVSDSPAFGTAKKIAGFLGLDTLLGKMGVNIVEMNRTEALPIKLPDGRHEIIKVGKPVLNADVIFSVFKIKAHGQMRMTLAVKNCFGCVPGPRKAVLHALKGKSREEFSGWLSGLYLALPPVYAVCDGVTVMSGTGPAKGSPYELGLIAACSSPQQLDLEILKILRVPPESVPLTYLLEKLLPQTSNHYALDKPEIFDGSGFKTPETLKAASFSPLFLFKSVLRRWWASSRLSKQNHKTRNGDNT